MDPSQKAKEQTPTVASDPNMLGAEAFDNAPLREFPGKSKLAEPARSPVAQGRLWAGRIFLVVYVALCIEIGMFLAVVPWTRLWTENSVVLAHPLLRALVADNFVRGVVTGIGLIDIWLGISEAVQYRE